MLAGALAAAVLLVAADLTAVLRAGPLSVSGHSQHGWAVLLLGLVVAVLGAWAARLGSRAALAGIAVVGLAVLLIALIQDVPQIGTSGVIDARLDTATTTAGPGFYLETAGAVVAIATGAFGLLFGATPTGRA